MGVRLTSDEGVCALFDSVTGWAFGPTFGAPEDADAFLAFLREKGEDGRELSPETLHSRHAAWLALNADERMARTYKVGDPDPTPDDLNDDEMCESESGLLVCTWPAGHPGQHIAGTGSEVAAVWS